MFVIGRFPTPSENPPKIHVALCVLLHYKRAYAVFRPS